MSEKWDVGKVGCNRSTIGYKQTTFNLIPFNYLVSHENLNINLGDSTLTVTVLLV